MLLRLPIAAFALSVSAIVAYAAEPVPNALLHSLFDPGTNAQVSARQGSSVAVDGNLVVVGVPLNTLGIRQEGTVRVYDATTGKLLHTLRNPYPSAGENFGGALAISGTRVVVGASWDKGEMNLTGSAVGAAYIYELASATPTLPTMTLTNPTPASTDLYGHAVAISGNRLIIGAPADDNDATDAGIAYVYDLGSGTPAIPQFILMNPFPGVNEYFGFAVAISGARAIVTSPGEGNFFGTAYVFGLDGATPTVPLHTLNNPYPAANDQFGYAVAASGNWLALGANQDDGGASDAGNVYVYSLDSPTPNVPVFPLNNPAPGVGDNFGFSLAMSGTRLIVGAVYDDTGTTNSGSAYVYDLASLTPTVPINILNNPGPAVDDNFGYAVAISGTRVVVGTPNADVGATDAGSAYVYDLTGLTPWVPTAVLAQTSLAYGDFFGRTVAVSGSRVVVGAEGDDTGATETGRAYVYDLASGAPNVPIAILNNPSPAAGDRFGNAVAISGMRVVSRGIRG